MSVNQQQLDYLSAMGIPVWVSRDLEVPDVPVVTEAVPDSPVTTDFEKITTDSTLLETSISVAVAQPVVPYQTERSPSTPLKAANELIRDLQGGVSTQRIADLANSLKETEKTVEEHTIPVQDLSRLGLQDLAQIVANCHACNLHSHRKKTVFARGNEQAKLMIVGDIPRLQDEQEQFAFSGLAGTLLSNMLSSLSFEPSAVYVTNLMKCRPPLDRSPEIDQAQSCSAYLRQQIDVVKPELVLLMGRDTAQLALGSDQSMAVLRQQLHHIDGYAAPMIATYHPAYLLKQPRLKAHTWQDLQYAQRVMSL